MRFEGETLSTEQSRIRKEETKSKEKEPGRFYKDPFQFARKLFQQPRYDSLEIQEEQLDIHLRKTYSDPNREIPLSEPASLVCSAASGEEFDRKPPSLK